MAHGAEGTSEAKSLPPVADIVSELFALLEDPDRPQPSAVMGNLAELHRTNLAQWNLEDTTRDPTAPAEVLAEAKRTIDVLNTGRHGFIERVDEAIDEAVSQRQTAPPATESPAMALDRLSVLVIRAHRAGRATRGSPQRQRDGHAGAEPGLRAVHAAVLGRIASLEEALEDLIQDVAAGRRRFVPYRSLKIYGGG